ncbi:MAG: hypothetical protein H0X27_03610 [Caulobacteraceae bacterium]|nr:hypothetical protein [Caulobacteraceae bacterium]
MSTPKGYQQITTLSSSTSLTVPAASTSALISVEGPNVRWRDDMTAPTASVGMPMYAGAVPQLFTTDLSALRFIHVATGAILNVSYYS